MPQNTRKQELMEATMKIIAEQGMTGFSMRQVTDRVGVSEALLYKYFGTKDHLLFHCYLQIEKQIAERLTLSARDGGLSGKTFYRIASDYLHFLVENDYRTLFFFEYRSSRYIKNIIEFSPVAKQTFFREFTEMFVRLNEACRFLDTVSEEYFWAYVIDTSLMFAKRVIRKELGDREEDFDAAIKLISGGILGLSSGAIPADDDLPAKPVTTVG